MKVSELYEAIKFAARCGEENPHQSAEEEHRIARHGVKLMGLPSEDAHGKINPIVEAVVYARHCGIRTNAYTAVDLICAFTKAWEYYEKLNPPKAIERVHGYDHNH